MNIKSGFRFTNSAMELTIICFIKKAKTNLGLAVNNDGLFVTFRNLQKGNSGNTWDWGHYLTDIYDALIDFDTRKKDM